MTQLKHCQLSDRAVLRLGGTDCQNFLQNLVTCNIDALEENQATFGGLLTPQGKILYDFFLVRTDGEYLIDVPQFQVDDIYKRLTFYKLRADVSIAKDGTTKVSAAWNGSSDKPDELPTNSICVADPRHPQMGCRIYTNDVIGGEPATVAALDAHRIGLGMPLSGIDYAYGDAFPHEALFDQIGAVDFRKGCYVGQEVVSRMHHRGTARKRVVKAHCENQQIALPISITADGKPVGELTSLAEKNGLAMVRLDRVQRARENGIALMAGEAEISLSLQDWVDYSWPISQNSDG